MFELTKADWDKYIGNNYEKIPIPEIYAGGAVSFKRHIGKPLSQELWEDLVHRFVISGLCVYKYDSNQWCVGWGEGHCIINLDKDEKVSDIKISPYTHFIIKERTEWQKKNQTKKEISVQSDSLPNG